MISISQWSKELRLYIMISNLTFSDPDLKAVSSNASLGWTVHFLGMIIRRFFFFVERSNEKTNGTNDAASYLARFCFRLHIYSLWVHPWHSLLYEPSPLCVVQRKSQILHNRYVYLTYPLNSILWSRYTHLRYNICSDLTDTELCDRLNHVSDVRDTCENIHTTARLYLFWCYQ